MWRLNSPGNLEALSLLLLVGGSGPSAWAEDVSSKASPTVRKTEDGLHFNVPPDWPIEKRGGIMAPIPIEEYLGRKFKGIESQLQTIEQRMNGLDVRLRVLEEQSKDSQSGLRSSERETSP